MIPVNHINSVAIGSRVIINFDSEREASLKYKSSKDDGPHPDFNNALQLLSKHVKRVGNFTTKWMEDVKIKSVDISLVQHNEELLTKICVIAHKPVDDDCHVEIRTPS